MGDTYDATTSDALAAVAAEAPGKVRRGSIYLRLKNERPDFLEQITNYCLLGATNIRLAQLLQVEPATFAQWIQRYPELGEAIHKGRGLADAQVARAMHKRAIGYEQKVQKLIVANGKGQVHELIEHIPAEVSAGKYWLNNRSALWNERSQHELMGEDGGPIDTELVVKFVGVTTTTEVLAITDSVLPANNVASIEQRTDGQEPATE